MEELLKQILGELKEVKNNQVETNQRLDKMDSRLDGIDTRLDGMDTRFDQLEQKVDKNTMILLELDKKVSDTKAQVSAIKEAVIKGEEAYDFVQRIKDITSTKG